MTQDKRRPAKAAAALQMAVVLDPQSFDAPARMAMAARAYGEAGRDDEANEQWALLAEAHPGWRGRANLGRAELALARKRVPAALDLFEDVVESDGERLPRGSKVRVAGGNGPRSA